jgi:hypothetical protein
MRRHRFLTPMWLGLGLLMLSGCAAQPGGTASQAPVPALQPNMSRVWVLRLLNIKSAGLGESMILSLRQHIFSSSSQRSDEALGETIKDKAGTFVAMIASEAEAVGKFVGDCISTPTVQAGTLLSVLGYML